MLSPIHNISLYCYMQNTYRCVQLYWYNHSVFKCHSCTLQYHWMPVVDSLSHVPVGVHTMTVPSC